MNIRKILALALALMLLASTVLPASAAEPVIDENSGWFWPTVGNTMENISRNGGFGVYRSYEDKYHQGIDIAVISGTNVYAARPGTVYRVGYDADSMGNYICIKHDGKTANGKYLYSTYMHLSSISVEKDQPVTGGQFIGKSGNTGGSSTGAHLHFHVFRSSDEKPASVSPNRATLVNLTANYVDVGKISYNGTTGGAPAASTLGISVTSAPSRIKVGTAWGMRGSVTSNYTITRVDGVIYNSAGHQVMSSVDYPNSTSMEIRYSQVNNALIFNDLKADSYRLVITARDSSGKTSEWSRNFEVYADASTLRVNMTSSPSSIRKGACYGLRGTVTSNYVITEVRGQILDANGREVDFTRDYPNSTSFNVRYGNVNNYLEFNWLNRGKYFLQITAYDASGKIYIWSKGFTVY